MAIIYSNDKNKRSSEINGDNALGASSFRLDSLHAPGPVGERWKVVSDDKQISLLADLLNPDGDEFMNTLCLNALKGRNKTESQHIANVIDTGWLIDGTYFQILEMSTLSHDISQQQICLPESSILVAARHLIAALRDLQQDECVHGAIAPSSIYMDGTILKIGELWWMRNSDGTEFHPGAAQIYKEEPPEYAIAFMAPEVLLGEKPGYKSDIYSVGSVLYFLATQQTPRQYLNSYPPKSARARLALTEAKSILHTRAELNENIAELIMRMINSDPLKRPEIDELIDVFHFEDDNARIKVPIKGDSDEKKYSRPLELTNELYLGFKTLSPGTELFIKDRYQHFDNVQILISHPIASDSAEKKNNEASFSATQYLIINSKQYLLLAYPPDAFEESDKVPIIVARINGASVATIADEELSQISEECSRALELDSPLRIKELEAAIGPIRHYE